MKPFAALAPICRRNATLLPPGLLAAALAAAVMAGAAACGERDDAAAAGAGAASSSSTSGSGGSDPATSSSGSAMGGACAGLSAGPGDSDENFQVENALRFYHVHVPPSYAPDQPTSVVLVFHGYFQMWTNIRYVTKMNAVSDAHGFIVVYPEGRDDTWNVGNCCGFAGNIGVDDVSFVRDVLDRVEADYCVDPKRVYAAGIDNGAMFVHRLACEMSDRIAAIGAVDGRLTIDDCMPERPVSLFQIQGTAEGPFDDFQKDLPETVSAWVSADGCTDAAPAPVFQQGATSCDEYQMCAAGSALRVCVVDPGGFEWPGGTDSMNMDLDASEAFVDFFEAHPLQ